MIVKTWIEVLQGCNLPEGRKMDIVSRWLILVRACVFSMTLVSGLIGGLLAAAAARSDPALRFDWLSFILAVVGILIAHAVNNMINDYFDLEGGVDTDEYVRAQYAPHPVLSGMLTRAELRRAIIIANLLDVAIGAVLFLRHGWPVIVFAGLGLFISVFYVAPPLRLKHHGLGEFSVGLVWGPLMIGGTYFVTVGALSWPVIIASLPYALLVVTVLVGKHMDKFEIDRDKGIRTLPVLIGYQASRRLNQALMILFYVIIIVLVLAGSLGVWALLALLALPQLVEVIKAFSQPRPAEPPPNYPVWPLWFVSLAFVHTRRAGMLFVLGLILNLIIPVYIG